MSANHNNTSAESDESSLRTGAEPTRLNDGDRTRPGSADVTALPTSTAAEGAIASALLAEQSVEVVELRRLNAEMSEQLQALLRVLAVELARDTSRPPMTLAAHVRALLDDLAWLDAQRHVGPTLVSWSLTVANHDPTPPTLREAIALFRQFTESGDQPELRL